MTATLPTNSYRQPASRAANKSASALRVETRIGLDSKARRIHATIEAAQ